MKTLKQLALLPLFFGLLLTTACTENYENGNENGNGERLLPSRVLVRAVHYDIRLEYTFLYDDKNRIEKMIFRWEGDYWDNEGENYSKITYNLDGTVATIRRNDGQFFSTFAYSNNVITRIRIQEGGIADTTHLEINNRGQAIRSWSNSGSEIIWTHDTNGNIVHIEQDYWLGNENLEYSSTVRAIFRNIATPEWVLQFHFRDIFVILPKHGFMPIKYWAENRSWENTFTYTEKNGYVRTMIGNVEEGRGGFPDMVIYFEYVNAR